MIQSLQLINFQSHQSTTLNFSEGVNLIVGSSNVGKTAILRALKWLVFNRPVGANYLSSFADKPIVKVRLVLDSGDSIERVKTKTENYYVVNDQKLTAVRSTVPKEVTTLLKLDELNFQFQHDGYFLVTDTPANIARAINKVVGLDVADDIIKLAKKLYDDKRREMKFLENQQFELEETAENITNKLGEIEPLFKELEEKIHQLQSIKQKEDEFNTLLSNIAQIEDTLGHLEQLLQYKDTVYQLQTARHNYTQITKDYKVLERLIDQIEGIEEKLAHVGYVPQVQHLFKQLEETRAEYNKHLQKTKEITDLLHSITQLLNELTNLKDSISEMEQTFYKESGGVCPVCKQKLPHS